MKLKSPYIAAACLATLALCAPLTASARAKKSAAPDASATPATATTSTAAKGQASPSAAKADRPIPYHGTISAVDTKAETFTIAGKEKTRVFKITSTSVLTKAGAPATIKDVTVNEEVRGSYWKKADGSMEAKSVKLGPLTPQEEAAKEAKKARHEEKMKAKAAAASPSPKA